MVRIPAGDKTGRLRQVRGRGMETYGIRGSLRKPHATLASPCLAGGREEGPHCS